MEDRKQLERRIVEKAMKDETFRNQLIEKPKETLELETGIKLPSGLNIHILEEKSDEVYLVLPFLHSRESSEELTDAELSLVAGGVPMGSAGDWSCPCV